MTHVRKILHAFEASVSAFCICVLLCLHARRQVEEIERRCNAAIRDKREVTPRLLKTAADLEEVQCSSHFRGKLPPVDKVQVISDSMILYRFQIQRANHDGT